MLNNAFAQLLVFFFTIFELLFIVKYHFFLLPQDLLNDLVLILSQLIDSIIRLHSERFVLLTHTLETLKVLVSQSVGLLFPCVTDLDQVLFLFPMDQPQLIAATRAILIVSSHLFL